MGEAVTVKIKSRANFYHPYKVAEFFLKCTCAIASKINVAPKGVRLSEKLKLTAALVNEI